MTEDGNVEITGHDLRKASPMAFPERSDAVPAAGETFGVALGNTGAVRELCEVEGATVIHLEETGPSVAGARSHDCVRMPGRISAAEVIRRVSASHWGIRVNRG